MTHSWLQMFGTKLAWAAT